MLNFNMVMLQGYSEDGKKMFYWLASDGYC